MASFFTSLRAAVEQLNVFFEWTSGILWGPWLLVLLVGTHLYLTFRLGVIQRWLWPAIKLTFKPERKAEGDVSPSVRSPRRWPPRSARETSSGWLSP